MCVAWSPMTLSLDCLCKRHTSLYIDFLYDMTYLKVFSKLFGLKSSILIKRRILIRPMSCKWLRPSPCFGEGIRFLYSHRCTRVGQGFRVLAFCNGNSSYALLVIFVSHEMAIWKGSHNPILRVLRLLTTYYLTGMILQVYTPWFHVENKPLPRWIPFFFHCQRVLLAISWISTGDEARKPWPFLQGTSWRKWERLQCFGSLNQNFLKKLAGHLSNEKNLGWLFDIGDYTTQLYGDYDKPI